jgi:hypothetical protein
MLLAFVLVVCFTLPFWLWRRKFSRIDWAVVVAFASVVSLLLAFFSIWSVWTPYITNWDFHDGEFNGYFPWSKLSYPLHLSVYHTPFIHLLYDGVSISGNASFTILIANAKVMKVNGTFNFLPVFGRVPLSYSLNFPLFNNKETFFIFLLTLFTILNMIGALVGIALANTLAKKKGIAQHLSGLIS